MKKDEDTPKQDLDEDSNERGEESSFLLFLLVISFMFVICWFTCRFIFGNL